MKKIFFLFLLFNSSAFSQTTWFSQNSGTNYDLNSVFFVNDFTGYCVGAGGLILKTINGGNNWFSQNSDYDYPLKSVFFLNENNGFAVGGNSLINGGAILKTTNGGINWITQLNFFSTLNSIYFTNINTGYAVGTSGLTGGESSQKVYNTTNTGITWNEQYSNDIGNNSLLSIYFVNENIGYSVGRNGLMLKTNNAGLNWSTIITSGAYNYYSIKFPNDSIGYISCSDGKIQRTTNYGQSWETFSVLNIPNFLLSTFFISSNTGFVVGTNGTLFKTTDGGTAWENQISNTNNNLNSIYFPNSHTGYVVGNVGTILKTTNGSVYTKINLKILLEGLYNSAFNQLMRKDSITLYLRNSTSPFELKDSSKNKIDTISFSNTFTFSNSVSGSYYIIAKHFNCLETWSKSGGEFLINDNSVYNYDFTTASTQAYGNILKLKGTKYCVYSGDLNQDGFINLTDLIEVYNNSVNFMTGINTPADLNGDNIVDLNDITNCYNNLISFVSIIRP